MSYKIANQLMDRVIALRPQLLRQAAFLIGKRTDIGSPEDFVQDTLLWAFQRADRFEDDNLSGWLIAIMHNYIRNARRRANRRNLVLTPLDATGDCEAEMSAFPVPATQELTLDLEDVIAALRRLSAVDQEIIWLARIEGLSPEDIGVRLSLAAGSVYSRLSRATANLRAAYDAAPAAATRRENASRRRAA